MTQRVPDEFTPTERRATIKLLRLIIRMLQGILDQLEKETP